MTIQPIAGDSIPAMTEAINAFRYGPEYSALPVGVQEKLDAARAEVSPVAKICATAEVLYAARAQLQEGGRTVAVQAVTVASSFGWWGLLTDNRGGRIAQALRKDNGETVPGYSAANDPEPLAEHVVAEPEAPAEPEPPEE